MIKRMISFVKPLIPALIISLIFGLIAESLQVVVAWYTGITLTQNDFSWNIFWSVLVFILLGGISAFFEQYSGHYVAFKILANIRKLVYKKIQKLAPAGLDQKQSADLLKLVGSDIEAMEIFYAHTIVPLFIGLIFLVVVSIVFATISPLAGLIYFLCGIIIGVGLPTYKAKRITDSNAKLGQVQGKIQQQMFEAIMGQDILLQLNAVKPKMLVVEREYGQEANLTRKTGFLNWQKNWMRVIVLIVCWISTALLLLSQGQQFDQVLPLLLSFPFAFKPVEALASLPDPLSKGLKAAKRIFELLDTSVIKEQDGIVELKEIDSIEVQHLSFQYPNRDVTILKDVSMSLKHGEIGGIIGSSGSGKSTLAKLIMKWYPVNNDSILINNIDLNQINRSSLWNQTNYLTQEPQIFSDTIRQNLTLGKENFSDEELWKILNEVQLSDLVKQSPKGLDEVLSATDLELSAGEAQRLALARALLHPSTLLILDEPTSNLDVLNEQIILYAIKKNYQGIVLMITHRAESLGICDTVWKMKSGSLTVLKKRL